MKPILAEASPSCIKGKMSKGLKLPITDEGLEVSESEKKISRIPDEERAPRTQPNSKVLLCQKTYDSLNPATVTLAGCIETQTRKGLTFSVFSCHEESLVFGGIVAYERRKRGS